MQCVRILPAAVVASPGKGWSVTAKHDAYTVWFEVGQPASDPPACACGVHAQWSRHRIWELNDERRSAAYEAAARWAIASSTSPVHLAVGDGGYAALLVASLLQESGADGTHV